MEFQLLLVVRRGGIRYLLVEDSSSKVLRFPRQTSSECGSDDILTMAHSILDEVLCLTGKIKGILKVIQQNPAPGAINSPLLTVVLVADEIKAKGDQDACKLACHWLLGEEVLYIDGYTVDAMTKGIISQLDNSGTIYSLDILDTLDSNGVRRVKGLLERQMLEEAGYGKFELDQIMEKFVNICGSPSALMNFKDFSELVKSLGMPESHVMNCFRALQTSSSTSSISLDELQLGLCALDPATPHGAVPGQIRCQFIFRFYNLSGKGVLSYNEFRDMYKDICVQRKSSLSSSDFESSVVDNWKNFGVSEGNGISLNKFLTVVGQLKFRGTSVLFRLPQSPVKREGDPYSYSNRPACPSPCPSPVIVKITPPDQTGSVESKDNFDSSDDEKMEVSCLPDDGKAKRALRLSESFKTSPYMKQNENSDRSEFTIATHSVKVRRSGTLSDVTTLWELVGTDAVSGSVQDILEHHKPSFDRLPSIKAFDKTSKSNEMLSGLRYFEHALRDDGRGKPKGGFSWGAIDMSSVARCFITICAQAVDIFASEDRLVQVKSPCYVLGDLHGNFHDLICFEKVLWRMGPVLTPASFLFLGDYVDRGDYGFEVIAYLFAQKLLMPSKFLLIRGNHEIRSVQESFTYKTECCEKFGKDLGEDVWEATNTVFDAMPIAAVIDSKIFCVHGGIPHPAHGGGYLSVINEIPSHLSNPIDESPLAWDIMWNDPVKVEEEEQDESLKDELLLNDGFIDNDSRGTAHMFSSNALNAFLERNNLSHVIRAHEVKETGFQLQQNGRLLTVFSSSHYCGASNEAACVLVDDKKIRTIRLDTRS